MPASTITIASIVFSDDVINTADITSPVTTVTLEISYSGTMDPLATPPLITSNVGALLVETGVADWDGAATTYTVEFQIEDVAFPVGNLIFTIGEAVDSMGATVSGDTVPALFNGNPVVVDTVAPAAPTVALLDDTGADGDLVTNNPALDVTGLEAGATVEYSSNGIDGWGTTVPAASTGSNTVHVRQVDAAGNAGPSSSITFTLDTTPPAAPTVALLDDTGTDGDLITNNPALNVTGIEAGATVEYSSNGIDGWGITVPTATTGSNTVHVRQVDVAGNAGPSTEFTFTLDTTDPAALATVAATINEYPDPNAGAAPGAVLATFAGTDMGSAPELTYSFANIGDADNYDLVDTGTAWELRVKDPAFFDYENHLAMGVSSTTVDIVTTDAAGNDTTTTFTVTLNDLNDAPVVGGEQLGLTPSFTERTDLAGDENDPILVTGQFDFSDDDVTDTHFTGVSNKSVTGTPSFLGTFLAGQAGGTVNGQGTVTYTLNITDQAERTIIDNLADGETIVQVYTITVTDLPSLASVEQDVTVTITGTNDAPVITSTAPDHARSVTELADNAVAPAEGSLLTTTNGTVSFSDVDTTDLHSAMQSATVTDGSGGTVASPLGSLTLGAVDQSAHTVGYTFTVSDADINFLGDGDSLTQVYTVTVSDDSGVANADATVDITITINGTNDAPVISATETNAMGLVEVGVNEAGVDEVSGDVSGTWADDDQGEQALLAVVEGAASGGTQGTLTFTGGTGDEAAITGTYGTLYLK
ncbi:VCBS domain-containing protein, partial [Phaeobacter sp. NW0010-22]|uniref:beta strand repeat-containing protein n=1 Tax=Phaeobacter sp. NW0010-22 TaxID=3135907 RepID=UPI003342D0AD